MLDGALDRDLTRVGRSRIAGKGLFAKRVIHKGMRIVEYQGRHLSLLEVMAEHPATAPNPYLLRLDEGTVIDGADGGSDARFVNHSCAPNCIALAFNRRVYVYALRDIARGEELTMDYRMRAPLDAAWSASEAARYACRCGAPECRGTRLSIDIREGT